MTQEVVVPIHFQLTHEATGASGLLVASSAMASSLLLFLGLAIWAAGFVWSLVLGKRQSVLWLWGLIPLWMLTYPVFVVTHWSLAKRNLAVILFGVALVCLGAYLAPSMSLWT